MFRTPRINWFLFVLYVLIVVGVFVGAFLSPQLRAAAWAPVRELVWRPPEKMPTTLKVAVPPALEAWVRDAAADFMRDNPHISVEVTTLRGVEAGRRLSAGATGLPDVWIAEAEFVRAVAGSLPYEETGGGVAQDRLLWVGGAAQGDLTGQLNWQAIWNTARSDAQFKIALPPANSVEGMAACLSAAAEYHERASVTAGMVGDATFRAWLSELLEAAPNRWRSPRDQLSSRPPEVNVGLILTSEWVQLAQQLFVHRSPQYDVIFNYPYFIRTAWYELSPAEASARRTAAEKFQAFLLGNSAQRKLSNYGLTRADAEVAGPAAPADESAARALLACWQR